MLNFYMGFPKAFSVTTVLYYFNKALLLNFVIANVNLIYIIV